LSGWREALLQHADAVQEEPIEVELTVSIAGVPNSAGPPTRYTVSPAQHWRGIPNRFRDHQRYMVAESMALSFSGPPVADIKIYERGSATLAWRSRT
jgi:hypothetical protein